MYEYRYHDGVVLRWAGLGSDIEINVKGAWKPYPDSADGDIRKTADAAWLEGSTLTEQQAEKLISEQ